MALLSTRALMLVARVAYSADDVGHRLAGSRLAPRLRHWQRFARADQVVQDLVAIGLTQREMALALGQREARAGNTVRQPLTVRPGHEPVVLALPDLDRHADRLHVEAPRLRERQIVVDPTIEAVLERPPQTG